MALGAPPGTSQPFPDTSLKGRFTHDTASPRDRYISATLIGGKGGAGPSSLAGPTGVGRGEWNARCMGAKSTWLPTWHWMECMFMVMWIVFQKPLLGGRPDANPSRDDGILDIPSRWFNYVLSCARAHVNRPFVEIAYGSGPGHIWLHATLEGLWYTIHDVGGAVGRPSDTFFWALIISWAGLLARVWSGPHSLINLGLSSTTLQIVFSVMWYFMSLWSCFWWHFLYKDSWVVMDDWNLDEIHVNYWNKVWYILHPTNSIMKYCHGWLKFIRKII